MSYNPPYLWCQGCALLPTLCAFLFVSSKSLREISKAPTKSPKQAPSASLRMVYHFFLIACNARYSMPLRGVAASFIIMSLSALRGVDAQRSRYVGAYSCTAMLALIVSFVLRRTTPRVGRLWTKHVSYGSTLFCLSGL